MPGGKKKGLFSKFRRGSVKKDEEAEESVGGGGASGVGGVIIPLIRADDAGAAIDDLQPPPPPPAAAAQPTVDESDAANDASFTAVKRDSFAAVSSSHTPSPTPSVDRLSVSFSPDLPAVDETESPDSMAAVDGVSSAAAVDAKVRFSKERHLSALGPDDEDDDELSDSLDAMLRRRESGRRRSVIRRSPKRGVSPLGSDSEFSGKGGRRRSSTMTSASCEETQISMEEPELTEEQMFENIKLHKELIEQVKKQPWKMRKRLKIVRKAKAYVRKHEGELEQRLAQSKNTKDVMARYSLIMSRYWERMKRHAVNLAKSMIPWEMRIKRIESHFGSAVASYFVFLRWVFWINIVMSIFISCFVIIPEVLAADRGSAGDRKELLPGEEARAFNLQTLWDFEGFLRYSPIFYGYYTSKDKTKQGYRIPFAYFMTLLGVYGYSFATILQRMAENTRQSKLSDKDEDCTFTWKLFTSWDYMIGNSETADNKVASILMGFKENILEEREKSKEERNWKVWALRVLANLMVLILLVSSAYAVVLVVQRSREPEADDTWWRQNESTVIISLISIIYPNLFDLIGLMENNHPRTQLRLQLARIMILYLLNLYTLIFSLFSKVDDMSRSLNLLRPNTTLAPSISSTLSSLSTSTSTLGPLLPVCDGCILPILVNGTACPFWSSMADDYQYPRNGSYIAEIMRMFDLSLCYHQLWKWNDTCVAVRANCDTRDYMLINDTQIFTATQSSSNTTPGPTWDYSDFGSSLYGMQNSSYLNFTTTTVKSLSLVLLPKGIFNKYNSTDQPQPSAANLLFLTTLPSSEVSLNTNRRFASFSTTKSSRPGNPGRRRNFTYPRYSVKDTTPRRSVTHASTGYRTTRTIQPRYPYFGVTETSDEPIESSPQAPWWNDTWDFSSTPFPLNDSQDSAIFYVMSPGCCVIIRCYVMPTVTPTSSYEEDEFDPRYRSPTTASDDSMDSDGLNMTGGVAVTESQGLNQTTRENLRRLCWETMFGQEIVKLTVMDLVMTVISILVTDFFRALIVRVMNHCCCWDLEKQFPGYGDFKIAENILHLVNNQGMIWMGMFFAPGIPGINMIKIVIMMYVRSWAVLTCNIPHETVFKASNSSNFYYALLLTMLFLCTLPVGYAIVWLNPSWHCGPFSQYSKIYRIFTTSLESILPDIIIRGLGYAASPGIMVPLLVLLILIIYYLNSVANSLREANKDLKNQLRRERTEERRKVFQMADSRHDANSKWTVTKKILPVLPSKVKMLQLATEQLKEHFKMQELRPIKKEDGKAKKGGKAKDVEVDKDMELIKPSQIKANKDKIVVGIHHSKKAENGEKPEEDLNDSKTKSKKKEEINEKSNEDSEVFEN